MQPSPEVGRRIERGLGDGRKTFCTQQRTAVADRSARAGSVCAAGETAAPIPAADPAAASTMRMSMFPAVS